MSKLRTGASLHFKSIRDMLNDGYCLVLVPIEDVKSLSKHQAMGPVIDLEPEQIKKPRRKIGKLSEKADKIMAALKRRKKPITNKELADKVGFNQVTSSMVVKKLVEAGKVTKEKQGNRVAISLTA